MALPKIDVPTYNIELPVSKKRIKYRPFLVKEQKNLLMAMEANDSETIHNAIRDVLNNCTMTPDFKIDETPIIDIEYYFLQLRARSVGEVVTNKYRCENEVDGKVCGNSMEVSLNLFEIKVEQDEKLSDVIQLTPTVTIRLKYPQFGVIEKTNGVDNANDLAFNMIIDSIDSIFDGQQYYYAKETPRKELIDFIEQLNAEQFGKIEDFFKNLPKLNKRIDCTCSKCGFQHLIEVEGLENFFG